MFVFVSFVYCFVKVTTAIVNEEEEEEANWINKMTVKRTIYQFRKWFCFGYYCYDALLLWLKTIIKFWWFLVANGRTRRCACALCVPPSPHRIRTKQFKEVKNRWNDREKSYRACISIQFFIWFRIACALVANWSHTIVWVENWFLHFLFLFVSFFAESPRRYVESDVNIHYKTPVRYEYKDPISDAEIIYRQEQLKKLYQEERRRKYLQELQDLSNRRHTDNFTPSQKSPIALNRYDDFLADFALLSPSIGRTIARALYNFQGATARYVAFGLDILERKSSQFPFQQGVEL